MIRFVRRLRDQAAALARRDDGATAVEFAMIAAPFFFMLFALLEVGIIFVISLCLDNAAMDVSRRIRTGEMQNGGGATAETFRDDMCARLPWPQASCRKALSIDVRTFEEWKDAQPGDVVQDGEFDEGKLLFNMGGPQSIVLVRAYFRWKLLTPFLERAVDHLNDGHALVTSTVSFRNEPY